MASERMANGVSQSNGAVQEESGKRRKLHGRAFYESIGSPKIVLAPMVEQSEFVWLPVLPCIRGRFLTMYVCVSRHGECSLALSFRHRTRMLF